MVGFAKGMFRDIWDQLRAQTTTRHKALERQVQDTQRKVDQLLDRIV